MTSEEQRELWNFPSRKGDFIITFDRLNMIKDTFLLQVREFCSLLIISPTFLTCFGFPLSYRGFTVVDWC